MKRTHCRIWTIVLLAALVGLSERSHAQLLSFSQPLQAPLFMNPAFTGKGDYMRLTVIGRSQWLNIKSPYNTYAASYDMHFFPYDNHSAGVSVLNDVQGRNVIQHMEAFLYYAYALEITYDFTLRMGVQGGVMMKATNYDGLVFPDDLSEVSETAVKPVYARRQKFSPDFGLGISGEIAGWDFGVAMHHIAEPYFDVRRTDYLTVKRSLVAHVSKDFNVFHRYRFKEPLYLTPHLIFLQQARNLQLMVGGAIEYRFIQASVWLKESLLHENHAVAASVGYVGKFFDASYTYDMGFMPSGFIGGNTSVHELTMTLKFSYGRQSHISRPYSRKNKKRIFGRQKNFRPKKSYRPRRRRH